MKRIILSLTLLIFMPQVFAINLEELNEYEIRYRFYKEKVDSLYYPKGKYLEGYMEDDDNIKYSEYSDWKDSCDINDNTDVEYKKEYIYQEIKKVGSIKMYDFSSERDQTGIIVYEGNKQINHRNISPTWNEIHLKLDNYYNADDLLIYAFFLNRVDFTVRMYSDFNFEDPILERRIIRSYFYNIIVNSNFYIFPNAYIEKTYDIELEENFFRKKIKEETKCRYRDILTYRYKIDKEYYDNNYYTDLEGYQKDYTDFKIYYQKNIDYIEVLKTEKEYINVPEYRYFEVPKYEYIKVEKEVPPNIEAIPVIKKEYIKEYTKENNKEYKTYLFIILIIILLIIIFKLIKKCRVN